MRHLIARILLAVLVLALVVPARLHALVAAEAPVHEHAAPHDHASMHKHSGAHHPAPEPTRPLDPQNNHAQCLTACLVIPVPPARFQAPMLRLRAIVAVPVTAWLDSLSPPRLDRPPRHFS